MKTLHTIYTNFAKRVLITLIALTIIGVGTMLAAGETGTISFGTNDVKINAESVTAQDNLGNTWTITTVGTTSYTSSGSYYQVGSSEKPATSITFTTTLLQSVNITNFSAKFGGFGSTAGNITLKVGETVVGSGNLNATNDVTVENTSTATGTVLTVTVTDIAKGVKCYYISYTYEIDVPEYNVYWVANNEQISADVVEQGSRVTLPSKPADCSNNVVFVGWTAQNNVNGAKPSDLFNGSTPLLQLPTIDEETTFRAVYAEVVDGVGTFAAGESGTFKLYAIVNGNNYYAGTGIDNRKLTSTTAIANAGDYTITHISDDQYTIQYGNQYISHANGEVDLQYLEYDDENQSKRHWTITRTGTNGTWRVASPVNNDRALVFTTANDNSNVFKAYATSNITADGDYYDLEIGNGEAISYQNYTTTCSTDVTVTLDPNGGTGDFTDWDEVDGNYTQTVEKGNSVTLPTLNDQTAYTFGGWSDGTTTHNAGTYTPETDVELTAVWTAKPLTNYRTLCTYDIVLKNNYVDDDSKDGHATITATKTTFNTFTPPTQRPGYTIAGYYAEPECTKKVVEADQTLITNVNGYTQNGQWIGGNVELYTKWQPLIYNLQSGNFFDWGTCSGGNLRLDGSAIGVKYQLYKDDVKYGEEISGTGGALIWEITESGNYTVKSVDPEMQMNGEAVVQLQDPAIVGENTVEVSKTITLMHPGHRDAAGSWVSSNPEIARVDNGIVTGVAAGTVTITFHGLGNCDAHHEVTVVNPEYTMTWKVGVEDEKIHATTTIISGNPILLPEPPADDALGCCADKFIGWTTSKAQNISKEDVFTTLDEAQDKFPNITEDKTFYAVFATAAQGVGTSIADFSEMGYENGTAVTAPIFLGDGEGHGDATIRLAKAQSSSNAPTYYTDGEAVRIYAGGTITIASSYHIKKVTFTFATGDGTNEITANSGTYVEGVWTENVESPTNNLIFTIGGEAGQHRRIASITITTGVSGSQYTNYVTKCTTLPNPALSDGSVPAIAVNCGDFSALSNSQAIVFSTMQNLTCPVTFEVIEGDFLISTARDRAAQYQSKVKVVPYKTGENLGKLKNVYVRANATDHNEDFTGTLKVTSDEIADDMIIYFTATVTCDKFTLTTVDHLGNETEFGTYFAGEVIDTEPTPSSDECTAGYTFDGWSTSAVEYGSLIYNKVSFPYTMPNHDVTLYPVYRINDTEYYHRVTSDLGANNWAGDYLIANAPTTFVDGKTSALNVADMSGEGIIVNEVVSAYYGDPIHVSLISVEGGYVLKTQDGKYIYNTEGQSAGTSVNENITTADDHPLSVTFTSLNEIVIKNPLSASETYFSFSSTSKFGFYKGSSIYLYKKSPLYTSYLACGTISVSEEEVYVTATKQRGIMANQPLTVTANNMYPNAQVIVTSNNADVYFSAERNANFAMAAANQPQQSLTLTADEAGELSQSIYIHYRPSSEGDGVPADVEVTAQSHNLPISDNHTIHVRNLPAKFVIATKVGAVWYALPANMTEPTNPSGVVIEVDETNMTAIAPTTTTYTLWPVKTTNGTGDRYQGYGERLRFASVNYEQRGLWANNAQNSATIRNDAVIDELGDGESNAYEWKVTTTVVDGHWQYTLKSDQEKNKKYLCYCTSAEGGAKWGTYESVDNTLYLLPMTEITEMNVEVMEWGTNSMALRFEGDAPANVDITLGETTTKNVPLTNLNSGSTSDIYKVEGVVLTTNDGEVLKIVDNTSNNIKLLCKPILVTGESVSTAYSTLETTVCDVVVLNGGKLSAGDAHVDFANIYVYPGGKLILDGKSLGAKQQVYLRGGYSWLNSEYALPELYLNGTIDFNGSGNIIYDYYIQNYKYYQFALPYDVQLAKVTDEAGIDNFPVWVKHYNGALRALDPHATSWEWYPSENGDANAYFKAGEGYIIAAQPRQVGNTANRPLSIIRFPLGNSVISSAEADKSIATTAHGIDAYKEGTITANNVGWNFIGNPFMSTWKGDIGYKQLTKHPNEANWDGTYDWVDADIKYITIMSAESGSDYAQYIASETELKPFFPFYLQETADGGTGTINFAAANRIQKAPAMLSAETPREAFVQIEIEAESIVDQTGMFIGDRYSDEIDFDDYEKMFGSSTDKPKVWLMHEGKRMAFEAVTESKAAAYTAIGYRAPQTGKYMFAINEEASKLSDVEAVYLTDNQTGVTDFDLLSSAYEFESNGELYNDSRFTIRIVLRDESPGTTTGVGNLLHFNSEQPMKFIYQDKMYILQNGVIYDAMGKQVQTINK